MSCAGFVWGRIGTLIASPISCVWTDTTLESRQGLAV